MGRIFIWSYLSSQLEVALVQYGKPELSDFFSLNISLSGMLIASKKNISFAKNEAISLVIDPWQDRLSHFISCDVRVARVVDRDSKGFEKYKEYLGDAPEISTIIGVYFDSMLPDSLHTLSSFIDAFDGVAA